MTQTLKRRLIAALAPLALAACSSLQSSDNFLGVITPYRVEVVQGNVVTKEQAALIKTGMGRAQVRDILGSPLLTDIFHADRWDYVFTLKRQGVEPQSRRLTVFFKGDELARFEGDPMPSESEFVAALDKRAHGKVPPLEATEDQLKRWSPGKAAAAPAAPAPVNKTYPPLEPTAR